MDSKILRYSTIAFIFVLAVSSQSLMAQEPFYVTDLEGNKLNNVYAH